MRNRPRRTSAALALVVTFGVLASTAGAAPRATGGPLDFTSFTLPNGLLVLVHEDHTVPLVGVEVYYHVGSKDESLGHTGFAHLFEHLMFKGSRNVADGEHFRAVSEAGGTCNATTNRDRTNYFEVVPASFLERALFLEADRMAHLLDGLSQASLDNQRDVVRNERRQNYENRPYGRARRAVMEAIFPPTHPYHWLTIGDHEDLQRASLAEFQAFFRRYYRPGNATLAIAGDVDPKTARALVERQFGAVPSDPTAPTGPPSPARTRRAPSLPMVRLAEEKRLDLDDQVSLERVTLAWPSPAGYAPGDAALDLLTTILGPTSGRLQRRLVHETQLAQNVSLSQDSALLGGTFEVTVTLAPGHRADEAVAIVDEELGKIRDGKAPITAAELARAQAHFESELFFGLMPAGGMSGRAGHLAAYEYFTGDPGFLARDLARYRAVTAPELAAAVRALGDGRVRLVVHPAARAGVEAR